MQLTEQLTSEQIIAEELKKNFRESIILTAVPRKQRITAIAEKDSVFKICQFLRDSLEFDHLVSIAAVDRSEMIKGYDEKWKPRYYDDFEMAYNIWSYNKKCLITLKTELPKEKPEIESMTSIWRSANWHEREQFDMMGVNFINHPDMRRLLLPYNWKGFPLRKKEPIKPVSWFITEEDKEKIELDYQEAVFELDKTLPEKVKEKELKEMVVRFGPVHPGTHGPYLINVKLDGEIIVDLEPRIGYIHRGLEKLAENRPWYQYLPVSDRYCWLTAIFNNLSYVLAVEELLGVKPPERAEYLRVIAMELERLASHLLWIAAMGIDLANLSGFFYPFREREFVLDLLVMMTGNRLNYNFGRFGGVYKDVDEKFAARAKKTMKLLRERIDEYEDLFSGSKIFVARTKGIGNLNANDAKNLGATGPVLRATGVKEDTRKNEPYAAYDKIDFDIPTEKHGDIFSMYSVRMREMRISTKIIDQALDNLPKGEIRAELPNRIEPVGEAVSRIEDARGEIATHVLGVEGKTYRNTIAATGEAKPYRVRIKTAELINLYVLPHMARGYKIADLIALIGGLDPCLGGIDR